MSMLWKSFFIRCLLIMSLPVFIALLFYGSAYAEIEQLKDMDAIEPPDNIQEWQFHEDIVELPDFPDFDKLKPVHMDVPRRQLKYYIDPVSLHVGRDNVVLVTIVIISERGARNILFEGYWCDTREYKTYAYGIAGDMFRELKGPEWKSIRRTKGVAQDFRRELVAIYFCDAQRSPLSHRQILNQIDYPQLRDDEGRMF